MPLPAFLLPAGALPPTAPALPQGQQGLGMPRSRSQRVFNAASDLWAAYAGAWPRKKEMTSGKEGQHRCIARLPLPCCFHVWLSPRA